MEFKINKKQNKVFIENNISKGVITIFNSYIELSIVKVQRDFRGNGYGKNLITYILNYIKANISSMKKIILSPLPLDNHGLNLEELIKLYESFQFRQVAIPPRYSPYMMEKYLL